MGDKFPEPLSTPGRSTFFVTPSLDHHAIVRVVRPNQEAPYIYRYLYHYIPGEVLGKAHGVSAFCLGTPRDPEQREPDKEGVKLCAGIGPIGAGTFLHEWDRDAKFRVFLYVHEYEGVTVNSVRIWDYWQGSAATGTYRDLRAAMTTAQEVGLKVSEALLRISGVRGKGRRPRPVVDYIGAAQGGFAKYDMGDKVEAAIKQMDALAKTINPYQGIDQIKEALGIDVPSTQKPIEHFDSGGEGPPLSGPPQLP